MQSILSASSVRSRPTDPSRTIQRYLALKKYHPPQDPTVGLSVEPYGSPMGVCCFL